jgi:hypothetical protein
MDEETAAAIDRVQRKRAARVLVKAWLSFTPCPVADLDTTLEPGDMPLTVTVVVKKADIDKQLTKEALDGPELLEG